MFSDEVSTSTNLGHRIHLPLTSQPLGTAPGAGGHSLQKDLPWDRSRGFWWWPMDVCSGVFFLTVSEGRLVRWYFHFINKETKAEAMKETDLIIKTN